MLFNSISFGVFLVIVFALHWILPHKYRWAMLFAASYYFYMSWNAKYVFLIFFTTLVSYVAGLLLEKERDDKKKKVIVGATLALCLGVLFLFKYFNFFFETLNSIFSVFSFNLHPITSKLLLPVGISFYTFQTLSYAIDVYRGTIEAEHHFGYYATYVSFFPQLVAGPIERPGNLMPQLKKNRVFDYSQATYGMKLMAWGFYKKIVVADNLAKYVDTVYNDVYSYSGFVLILATLFFTIQVYCDFSGYSDIAKGCAKLLGIELMDNFKAPYFSTSIKEFWSKWHISLSTWFKDYVYIPLGGNRCSKLRNYFNLLITFLISGLWHGANMTFVIWGGIHGLGQVIENILGIKKYNGSNKMLFFIRWLLLFFLVSVTWIFFRANELKDVLYIFNNFYRGLSGGLKYFADGAKALSLNEYDITKIIIVYFLPLTVFDYFLSKNVNPIDVISSKNIAIRYFAYILLILVIVFYHAVGEVSFIYFQF